jgi:thioredoxin 2
MLRTL